MKIAIVHNLPSGGGKRALYEFTRVLHQHGHELDVYIPTLADEQFLPLTPHVRKIVTFPMPEFRLWQTRCLPFLLQYLNFPRKMAYLERLKRLYASMAQRIDAHQYALVFVHHCRVLQSPYILRYLHTPSVYFCQEPPRRLYEPPIQRGITVPLKKRIQTTWYAPADSIYRWKMRHDDLRNARAAKLVLANSYYSRESIYRVYGLNARVNYLGVDIDRFHPQLSVENQGERLAIAVGRTYPEKGYDFLIQALSYVPVAVRPVLLIAADMRDPNEEHYLTNLARQSQVTYRVISIFSDVELRSWYQKAQICLYAPIMEPLGLAPLEAMACGVPVVAVKEGGVRETVRDGETGFLTQRDPQEFAAKVQFLLEHPELRQRFSEQARQHVETSWTWEHSTHELLQNFQRVVG